MSRPYFAVCVVLAACASSAPPPARLQPTATKHAAHELLVDAEACFLGGMWGDVQGQTPGERELTSEARCGAVVNAVFARDPHDRYLQLRAHEAETIAEVRNRIAALADAEPAEASRKQAYLRLFDALTGAENEVMLARRATHRVLRDEPRNVEKLSETEASALPALEASSAFDALAHVDAGNLQKEAHVLQLFVLLDRMQVAEQLPVHLKPYVVAASFQTVFGTAAPDLPHDASKPLPRGGWLTYLEAAAASAGHPVNDASASFVARHESAVAGILQGIADQLVADQTGVSSDTDLARILQLTIRSLEQSKLRAML